MSETRARRCFVIMPFGTKTAANPFWTEHDALGREIDFDRVYAEVVEPAVADLGLECERCDHIARSGSIHRQMIEAIVDADVAVVDLTTLNPNVFYELGVRHALRPAVTVLLRHRGIDTDLPFNIGGMHVTDYDLDDPSGSIERLASQIRRGLDDPAAGDSLVHDVLGDEVTIDLRTPRLAPSGVTLEWEINGAPDRRIGVISGDIADVRGIDIWVSSENTDLQLARYHEPSLSGSIRYLAAERTMSGRVRTDLLELGLRAAMEDEGITALPPGEVLPVCTDGQLHRSHGTRWVFVAASVVGQRGSGYRPIADVTACVRSAMSTAERPEFLEADATRLGLEPPRSMLFPLFGTGRAGGSLRSAAAAVCGEVVSSLRRAETIRRAYVLAWSEAELDVLQAELDQHPDLASVPVEAATP